MASLLLSDRIIDGLRGVGQTIQVTVRDQNDRLSQIDRAWIEASTTLAKDRSDDQRACLALSETPIAGIEAADMIIVGVPTCNFSVPASLKLWTDLVCRARRSFAYGKDGPKGLLTGKSVIVCFASGGTPFG